MSCKNDGIYYYTYRGGFHIWVDQAAVAAAIAAAVIVAAVTMAAATVEVQVHTAVPVFTAVPEAAVQEATVVQGATVVQEHLITIMVHVIMVRGIHLHHLHHADITTVGEEAVADVARLSYLCLS